MNVYNKVLDNFEAAGGQLVAISSNVPDSTLSTVEKHDLQFEVLTDVGNKVTRKYGLVYTLPDGIAKVFEERLDLGAYDGNDLKQLPITATYVIDKNGIIQYAFIDADYKNRAEPSEIIEVLNSLK